MKFRDKPTIMSEEEKKQKEQLAEQILAGADRPASLREKKINGKAKEPWEEMKEEKETVVFSFRIPGRDMQKLKYIARETKMSINTICLSAIKSYSKKKIIDLKKEI